MAFDLNGNLLVVDSSLDAVVRLSQYNAAIMQVYDGWTLQDPRRIVVEESGTWIVTDGGGGYGTNPGEVYRLDPVTGTQTLLTGAIDNPNGLAIVPTLECGDGVDNDGNGSIDLADPGCDDIFDDAEFTPVKRRSIRCGLGYEQMWLLPLLMAVRRHLKGGR